MLVTVFLRDRVCGPMGTNDRCGWQGWVVGGCRRDSEGSRTIPTWIRAGATVVSDLQRRLPRPPYGVGAGVPATLAKSVAYRVH